MRIGQLALAFLASATFFDSTHAQFCVENIEEIYTAEATVTDTSVRRTYVLCPRRIFEIGTLNHNFDLQGVNVNPPLPIRSNMTILCGDTGARDNLCWIAEGDLHVDATPFRGISDASVEGVRIDGLVFIGSHKYSTWATKPGDITFTDCEWRDHTKSVVPIMLDFFDGSSDQLSVTFQDCDFKDNRYFGLGSHTSLVYANGQQNALAFRDTKFENNDMLHNNTLSTTNSFMIETLGPLTMAKTCFRNNEVGVSSVGVFGNSFNNVDNFETNSTGDLCGFASVFETLQQFDSFTPLCVNAGSSSCTARGTSSPTTTPSAAPTPLASDPPSSSPSQNPTGVPTTSSPTRSPAPTFPGQTPAPIAPATAKSTSSLPPIGFALSTEPPAVGISQESTVVSGGTWVHVGGVATLVFGVAGALLLQ